MNELNKNDKITYGLSLHLVRISGRKSVTWSIANPETRTPFKIFIAAGTAQSIHNNWHNNFLFNKLNQTTFYGAPALQ
jgi:hypothetical protein